MIVVRFEMDSPILRGTRETVPDMTTTIESEHALFEEDNPQPIRLLFWASGGDFDALESALESDPTVTGIKMLSDADHRRLYRVHFTEKIAQSAAYQKWVELDGSLLAGQSTDNGWQLQMRFPDRSAIVEYQSWFEEHDLPFTVTGIYTAISDDGMGRPQLTDKQREILYTAVERGYFDIPRQISLADLAGELGISNTAASQRLRRGLSKLVEYDMTIRSPED